MVETQRINRLRGPITRVCVDDVEIVARRIGGGGDHGSGVTRGADRGEPATHVLTDPFVDARGVGGRDGVSRAISVGKDRIGGTGGRLDAVVGGQRVGGLADEERGAAAARDGAEGERNGLGSAAGEDDIRSPRAQGRRGEGLRRGGGRRGEEETTAAVADVGELDSVELGVHLRSRSPTEDQHRVRAEEIGGGVGIEGQLQGADLVRRTRGHARRAGDDGGGARVGLAHAVDVEGARTDLGQAAGAGEHRAIGGALAAVTDTQVDRVVGVIDQRHVDGRADQAADREGARGDAGVENDAARVHHVRDVDGAVGEGVRVLQQDRAVDDGGVARESVGAGEREHAVADLGEATGEAFAAAARGGAVADRASELYVIAVGVEEGRSEERDAARDRARA